jgi:hypothetical protein
MTMRSAKLRRLHFLNALFAPLTGQDLYLAEQIDGAIASSFEEVKERTPADNDFVRAAAQLFDRLCRAQVSHGFFHWDATTDHAGGTPLFARAGLMEGLKALAPCREATVLVTNLRAAQCPPETRWTAKRQRDYDDVLTLLRQLTAARTRRNANVHLLFL